MSAAERSRDFINIEDLLCRSERKTHQKTYRNRNRHGQDAETTLQTSSSPPKGLSNGDPAPPNHVAAAEDQANAAGTAQESRKRNGRHKNGCEDDDLNSVKYKATQQTKHPRHAPGKVITPVKSAEGSSLSRRVCPLAPIPSRILIARRRLEITAAPTQMVSNRKPHGDRTKCLAPTK